MVTISSTAGRIARPGDTEINADLPQPFRDALDRQSADIEMLRARDIADALVRATEQTW
ncbi:MAG: hypothetical protein JO044_17035 [Mycobacteriaceae bacterium]|nr:hypothetical protein [Mycobacteriaceae bacterium]MBV9640432.1 hypothetical protein [Mycobacteriaceae bacterium]